MKENVSGCFLSEHSVYTLQFLFFYHAAAMMRL